MRAAYEIYNVFQGRSLVGSDTISKEFPLTGETWKGIRMAFKLTTTHAAENYPFELAGYYFLKNCVLTADGRQLVQAPGAALYWLNALARGKAPFHQNVLAAAATYVYVLTIPFTWPKFNRRAEDLMFDSGAYSNVSLQLTVGGIADVFQTVSTATVSCAWDLSIIRTRAGNSLKGKPIAEPYIKALPQIASADKYWDIESNENLKLFGFYILSGGSSAAPFFQNGGANGAWGGVDAFDKLDLDDSSLGYVLNNVPVNHFQESRNDLIPYLNNFGGGTGVASPSLVGLHPHVFTRDGSSYSAYPTGLPNGKKSRVRLQGDNITPSNYHDLLIFGGRKISYDSKTGKMTRY